MPSDLDRCVHRRAVRLFSPEATAPEECPVRDPYEIGVVVGSNRRNCSNLRVHAPKFTSSQIDRSAMGHMLHSAWVGDIRAARRAASDRRSHR